MPKSKQARRKSKKIEIGDFEQKEQNKKKDENG